MHLVHSEVISDVFLGVYSATDGGTGGSAGALDPFLVTPCPAAD